MNNANSESYRLWRIRKTVLQMLDARGYMVLESEKNMDLAEFESKFGTGPNNVSQSGQARGYTTIGRDRLSIVTSMADDPSEMIFVFFPATKAIGMKQIKDYHSKMKDNNVKRAILVLRPADSFQQKDLSSQAKRAIEALQAIGYILETFKETELLVNITEHVLVPQHVPLNKAQHEELLQRYKLKETQLPRMKVTDPIARYYGLQRGAIVKIIRSSETAGRYVTYRYVV
ncbi:predicted protein [Naegleria gruberi]|uniref:Predicted protein n=1 Tax=Naegleria gruberi TaxID=5762 RepID=D2UZT4_NAEGR|nr:uncharacterized protein NAEGRDRAFT_29724 [Naegleria gruberi]EFC50218.1 predicted protein [Naegleria gruberi]|eukprot:XP_002682962.1 predicted protein [Naegleria gruberi strain NEG-M]